MGILDMESTISFIANIWRYIWAVTLVLNGPITWTFLLIGNQGDSLVYNGNGIDRIRWKLLLLNS